MWLENTIVYERATLFEGIKASGRANDVESAITNE